MNRIESNSPGNYIEVGNLDHLEMVFVLSHVGRNNARNSHYLTPSKARRLAALLQFFADRICREPEVPPMGADW